MILETAVSRVNIAPDLDEAQVGVITASLRAIGIDGVIATRTAIKREAAPASARR